MLKNVGKLYMETVFYSTENVPFLQVEMGLNEPIMPFKFD
jgi:hypothetical protein